VDLPEPLRRQHRTAQQLTLGIRPEAVSMPVGNLDAIPGYRLRGQVELVEQDFARRTQFVHLRSGDLTYVATAEPERRIRREEVLDVLLPFDQLTYFDTETEVRLS
jgi:hypothetical protein